MLSSIRGFFDIHVEGIEQQPEIIRADAFDKFQPLRDVLLISVVS